MMVVLAVTLACGGAFAQTPSVKSAEVVRIADTDYYLHEVMPGETVYSLSKLYNIPEERVYEDNPAVKEGGLKAGEKIKIVCVEVPEINMSKRKMQRTFTTHVVESGETTYSISKRYSLSINTLIQDNPGLDPAHLKRGQELLIRKSEMDKTSPQTIMTQMDEFADALSSVSDDYIYHLVEMGETLYALSKEYQVPVEAIEAVNPLQDGLKAGILLKIPAPKAKKTTEQPVDEQNIGQAMGDTSVTADVIRRAATGPLNVSMLLPLSENGSVRSNFLEFYQGALLAVERLRAAGNSINLNLFNTERSPAVVKDIVTMDAFVNSDLIIGPVYEEGLKPVMEFSKTTGIPVVSPLAYLDYGYGDTLFQLSPETGSRLEKMKQLFEGEKNIILISSDVNDAEFEKEVKSAIGNKPHQRVHYRKGTPSQQIDDLITGSDKENVFVVLAGNETGVDLVLAALSSVQNSRLSRSRSTGPIRVVGNTKWTRFKNVDRNLFFKLNVSFITSYHADKGNPNVMEFDGRYMTAFGEIPTQYSYRGYDAVMLFTQAIANTKVNFTEALNLVPVPLQTPYHFAPCADGNICNTEWALVTYGSNYTISVK